MALRTARTTEWRLSHLWNRPIEWVHTLSLRLLERLNQERWALLLTIIIVVMANLVLLQFMLQGQDNRAIAYTILLLLAPLMILIPELAVATFIIAGSRLIVNAMYFASPLPGTGERFLITYFFLIVLGRAIYEYLRLKPEERPRIFTWFTVILGLFWLFHMGHVAYIYLFRYNTPPVDQLNVLLGYGFRPGIFRYFDAMMFWIGVLPLIILLRDFQRFKRVMVLLGIVVSLAVATVVAEYFTPLPVAWKIVFQIRGAGETTEGYRVQDPAVMYLMVIGLFTAIYSLGYLRGWQNVIAVSYIALAVFAVALTKNRALWGGILPVVPFALLWKSPAVLVRQANLLVFVGLLFGAGMLNPQFNQLVVQKYNETMERWQRNYAFGGDPRNDPSYQFRLREKEAWDIKMARLNTLERLFGKGLEEPYGFHLPMRVKPEYRYLAQRSAYYEKISMHFSWLHRLLQIGIIGTTLLALTLAAALLRTAQAFLAVKHPYTRALLMGVGAGTLGAIAYDAIHTGPLANPPVLPVVLLWCVAELTFHWHRTGQLQATDVTAQGASS